jgi:hypothetical protein
MNPRPSDGLVWACEDFRSGTTGGGFHLEDSGLQKEAHLFSEFFLHSELMPFLFNQSAAWTACLPEELRKAEIQSEPAQNGWKLAPNPVTNGSAGILLDAALTEDMLMNVFSISGVKMGKQIIPTGQTGWVPLQVELPNGTYLIGSGMDIGSGYELLLVQ